MSYGQQGSESQQSRGLMPEQRYYFSQQAPGAYKDLKQIGTTAGNDPAGLGFMSDVETLLPTGRYGLPASLDTSIYQLGRDMYGSASSARSLRGYNTPASYDAVVGDALRMASGQLASLATNYALQRASIAPQLRAASFGFYTSPYQYLSNLLAGTGEGSSTSSGFGFDVSALAPKKG